MAKNWHMDVTKGLVDVVNSIVTDYTTVKKEDAKTKKEEAKKKKVDDELEDDAEDDAEEGEVKKGMPWTKAQFKAEAEAEDKKSTKKPKRKDIKLSGKEEKININPDVKENSLENVAMGVNPFQRAYQQIKVQNQNLDEAFQHTWGYGTPEEVEYQAEWTEEFNEIMAIEGPNTYIDPLQVKVLYTTGVSPRGAADRILGYTGYRAEETEDSNFQSRRRRFDLGDRVAAGNDSDYE